MCAPKLSLTKSTVRVTYFSELPSSSAICWPTSAPMATTNTRKATRTPTRMTAVAVPRRQPRLANRFTPGSTANDRNNETSSKMKSV